MVATPPRSDEEITSEARGWIDPDPYMGDVILSMDDKPTIKRHPDGSAHVAAWIFVPPPPLPPGPEYVLLMGEPMSNGSFSGWYQYRANRYDGCVGGYRGDEDGKEARAVAHRTAKRLRKSGDSGNYGPGPVLVAVIPRERFHPDRLPPDPVRFPLRRYG